MFAATFLAGFAVARAGASRKAQAGAGLVVGATIGLLVAATFAVVDNVWLDIVAQQQTKIDGFAQGGAASMRDFINDGLIGVAVFLPIALGIIGAMLGLAGGLVGRGPAAVPSESRRR